MGEACKVLIVDDEMLIRQGIINYIEWEQEGFQIVGEASNGKEAMQKIAEFSPHIVITDIVMPIMDGIDLVREAKLAFPDIEIIVLSSFENFDYVRSTFQNGVADYILKPKLNGPELLRILNKAASRIPDLHHAASLVEPKRSTEEVLEQLILGYGPSADLDSLSAAFTANRFMLASVHGENLERSQLKAAFERAMPGEASVFVLDSGESDVLLLFNFNPDQLERIKQAVETLASENRDAVWMLGKPFDGIGDLKSLHDENLLIMKKYLFYLPEQTFFTFDGLPEEKGKTSYF
ncbi:response regulator [Planococcus glaciei]|nr:response regulator [Planococcus glaciei]QDY45772.1 response regulator [Planococcus glaciei]